MLLLLLGGHFYRNLIKSKRKSQRTLVRLAQVIESHWIGRRFFLIIEVTFANASVFIQKMGLRIVI